MSLLRRHLVALCCVCSLACGSSESRSPLILGDDAGEVALGPVDLSNAQAAVLKGAITSTGEPCERVVGPVYLRDRVPGSEAWDVRCGSGSYSVVIVADGTPARVRPCFDGGLDYAPCEMRGRRYRDRQRSSGALNPDLGKLLEPMTATDGKTD